MLICTFALNTISCATNTANKEKDYVKIYLGGNHQYYTNSKQVNIIDVTIDNDSNHDTLQPLRLATPGHHKITVKAIWSNSWEDQTTLDIDLVTKKEYQILIFELAENQTPEQAVIRQKTSAEQIKEAISEGLLEGFLEGFAPIIIMTFPVWLPIVLLAKPDKKTSQNRPFANCCYIWIEDIESGKTVAGHKP